MPIGWPKWAIRVVCTVEMPNREVLERVPIRRSIPGSIEQQGFGYTRHGTVNIRTFLIVHNGVDGGDLHGSQ
jgi:hypothetical protein